jgi:hypothetical protein
VLAVVQHDEQPPVGERRDEPLGRVTGVGRTAQPGLAQAQGTQHRVWHVAARGQRRQLDEAHLAVLPPGRLHGEAGFARAARPVKRDQSRLAEQLAHPAKLLVPPHEAGELRRQPRHPRRLVAQDRHVEGRHLR